MKANTYQRAARETLRLTDMERRISEPEDTDILRALLWGRLGLGLAGEAGEFTELVKKITRGEPIDRRTLTDEAGDVLWYLSLLLDQFDIDLEDVMAANIAKLTGRAEDGTLHDTEGRDDESSR